jgi:undecaprenyl-diphosphatase
MISVIQAIILSIVQGISEWFPISSSGHLAIFQNFFGFQNLSYDVFLHLASVLAVIFVYWKDIINLIDIRKIKNLKYIGLIIIGIIPAAIVGVLFRNQIERFFSSLIYLGFFFIVSGIIVYSTKFFNDKHNKTNSFNFFDSIFIGIFQALALLPGISRSGSTISSGCFRGISREESAKFSFLMAVPIIFGAGLIETKNLIFSDINYFLLILSFLITLLVSLFSIKVLLKIIKGNKFYLFGIYNILIGIFLLIWSFL